MKNQKAFTLIELLVVVAIIGLLSSVVIAGLKDAKERAEEKTAMEFAHTVRVSLGSDLVGEWTFDEGVDNSCSDGDDVCDTSGNKNNGVWSDAGAHWADGIIRKAGDFNGSRYVEVSNDPNLNITDEITIELWTYNTRALGGASHDQLFGKGMSSTYSAYFSRSTGIVTFRLYLGGTQRNLNSTTPISVDTWQHWSFTYNNSSMKIYFNGELNNNVDYSGVIGTNVLYFSIGKDPQRSYYFKGLLDEVRIYNRALTTAEIQKHYAEGAEKHDIVLK